MSSSASATLGLAPAARLFPPFSNFSHVVRLHAGPDFTFGFGGTSLVTHPCDDGARGGEQETLPSNLPAVGPWCGMGGGPLDGMTSLLLEAPPTRTGGVGGSIGSFFACQGPQSCEMLHEGDLRLAFVCGAPAEDDDLFFPFFAMVLSNDLWLTRARNWHASANNPNQSKQVARKCKQSHTQANAHM